MIEKNSSQIFDNIMLMQENKDRLIGKCYLGWQQAPNVAPRFQLRVRLSNSYTCQQGPLPTL